MGGTTGKKRVRVRPTMTDADNPRLTDKMFAQTRPAADVLPPELYAAQTRRRGPQKAATKRPVTIRLDRDLVEALQASGTGWQGRANELLRKAIRLKSAS